MRFSRFLQLNVIIFAVAGMLVCATPSTLAAPASQTLTAPVEFQSSVISIVAGPSTMSFGVIGAPTSGTQNFTLSTSGLVTTNISGSGSVVAGPSSAGSVLISGPAMPGWFLILGNDFTGPCTGGTTGTTTLSGISFAGNFLDINGIDQIINIGGTMGVSDDAEGFFTCTYGVSFTIEPNVF